MTYSIIEGKDVGIFNIQLQWYSLIHIQKITISGLLNNNSDITYNIIIVMKMKEYGFCIAFLKCYYSSIRV